MDNCEAYRGLRDLVSLFQNVFGDSTKAAYYNAAADSMLRGINSMWMNVAWAIYKDGAGNLQAPSVATTWYPDAISQLFPILTGVTTASGPRSVQAYDRLSRHHRHPKSLMMLT